MSKINFLKIEVGKSGVYESVNISERNLPRQKYLTIKHLWQLNVLTDPIEPNKKCWVENLSTKHKKLVYSILNLTNR
jgi:hypothetical protein